MAETYNGEVMVVDDTTWEAVIAELSQAVAEAEAVQELLRRQR
jgi:hypothetical protein